MKKLLILVIFILVIIFLLMYYMIYSNNNYFDIIKKNITKNLEIKDIQYLNEYDNYYILLDKDYLYLIDNEYNEILRVERFLIHDNIKDYDIIYKEDHFMYFNDLYDGNNLVYEYYDIYKYELIDRIIVGGNDG